MIYLACPYSDPDRAVRVMRFEYANRAAAKLMREGAFVFSPISHTHPIAEAGTLPGDWNYWRAYDTAMIAACDKLIVLKAPGWDKSEGVLAEMEIAAEHGLPVALMEVAP